MIGLSLINKPIEIAGMTLQNRLVLPPMAMNAATPMDGKVTRENIEHYERMAHGGHLGLVILEHCYIAPEGKASVGQIAVTGHDCVDPLRELADAIHACGSPAVCQINHAGGATTCDITGTADTYSPSGVPFLNREGGTKAMTQEDIDRVVSQFALSARAVKEAGFDGVEIHSAHGYLLNQFASPITNKRQDKYGGSLENRLRIHVEILDAVRQTVGDDFPIFLRLGAADYKEGGNTKEDAPKMAALLAEKASLDVLDISGGLGGYILPGKTHTQGYFSELTKLIRPVCNLPLILTGGITSITAADKLLLEDKADLIGVGRSMLSDSNWAENELALLEREEAAEEAE